MARSLGAAVLAATVLFFWGFLYWGVLPIGMSALGGAPQSAALQQSLDAQLPETGVYLVPWSDQPESDTEYHKAHTSGPLAMIYFRKQGAEPMAPAMMIKGWSHQLLCMLVMVLLLSIVGAGRGFGDRFLIIFIGGVAGSLFARLGDPIWWYHPWSMAWTHVIYEIVAWLLAGLVLGGMLRPGAKRLSPTQL